MQFTKIASVLAMAAAAIAAPAPGNYEIEPRTGGGNNQPVCAAQSQQVCCSGLLNCVVQVLGTGCKTSSFCCKTDAPTGALVNVALLNCVDLL
ncbi:hydrophobin 3 [Fusarium redolens]|uniref:Hydrophobin 3 n=1 Tax=Fusarium redolens TaxID=48865 RepID=A0A9P9FXK6_FUSRE|nr:hydrophobin 3 [Fusarium redolens]KAH7210831.1 hydrophobin 3 [Fusarium redolens]